MSVRVSTWVWHDTTAKGNDLLVLLALADCADDNGWSFHGIESLAAKTRLSAATLHRRLEALSDGDLIERYRRGQNKTNVYRVAVPWSDVTSWPENLSAPSSVKSQIESSRISQSESSGSLNSETPDLSRSRDPYEPSVETSVTSAAKRRRKPETPLDPDWRPNDSHIEQAAAKGLDVRQEFQAFSAHAAANDRRLRDWDAGFRMWLTKARPSASGPVRRTGWDRAFDEQGRPR